MRADERHDRVDAVTRGMLGLTVGCARCHDHKYDPIPTKDYYSLAGVFLNTEYHEYPLAPKAIVEDHKAPRRGAQSEAADAGRIHQHRRDAARRHARLPVGEVHAGGVAGDRRAEEGQVRDDREGEARLRALRSLAGISQAQADLLSVPEGLAGDDRERRHGEGSREARHRVPAADCERAARGARAQERERHHQGAGPAVDASRRSRRTNPTSSRPTTTSVRAAASSCAA